MAKWQDDEAFVQWLLEQQYAEKRDDKLHSFLSGGVVLYMHEAWSTGKQEAKKPKPLICQCSVCRQMRSGKEDNGALLTG